MRSVKTALFALLVISLPGESSGAEPDPCKAASTKTAYEAALSVPAELKKKIEGYRSKWRLLCDRRTKKARPSLAELYGAAAEISKLFEKRLAAAEEDQATAKGATDGKADKISDLVTEKYPAFIPAFEGSYIETVFFRPMAAAFEAKVALGTDEDRAFWRGFNGLRGLNLLPPWYEQTWDYGGCLRFGEFDWVKEIEALEKTKKSVKSVPYAELITELESALVDPFERAVQNSSICACKSKEAVAGELKKLSAFLSGVGAGSTLADKLKPSLGKLIGGIEAKKIAISSQAEAHCSGG